MGGNTSKDTLNLTDEDVKFLTSHTKYKENEIREWYKGFQKDCPDGKLTKEKFVEIYKLFFLNGSPSNYCEHVFRTFDSDQNGYIDFKEFLLVVGITTGNNLNEKLKWIFKMYDINNDGFIDIEEFEKIIKSLYEMLGTETTTNEDMKKVQIIFDKMNTNSNKKISMEEFIKVCTHDAQLNKLLCFKPALSSFEK